MGRRPGFLTKDRFMAGDTVGSWTIQGPSYLDDRRKRVYPCICACGTKKTVASFQIGKTSRSCHSCCNKNLPRRDLAERFWVKVDRSGGKDACWPWMGAVIPKGYGMFAIGWQPGPVRHNGRAGITKTEYAHRLAWGLTFESLPSGDHEISWNCLSRPLCMNPAHMIVKLKHHYKRNTKILTWALLLDDVPNRIIAELTGRDPGGVSVVRNKFKKRLRYLFGL